jgi:radical SAM protein with 4Fe4S-binding SPASM domain
VTLKLRGNCSYKACPPGLCRRYKVNPQDGFSLQNVALTGSQPWMAGLDLLWLEVTGRCNLECIHCYADSSPQIPLTQGMSYERWVDVLREGFALGCRKVQFIGGEPTLYPYLLHLISDARVIGYEFLEVYTNGTLLRDEMLEVFRDHNVCLAFSVYGPQAKVHDEITRRKGSYLKTIEGIRRAVNYGISVRAAIIEMPENIDNIEATEEVLQGLGVGSINTDHLRGVGRGKTNLHSEDPFQELCGACWRGQLAIDPQGDVFPCVFSRFWRIGNVSSGLRSLLYDERLHTFRMKVKESIGTVITDPQAVTCKPTCAPYVDSGQDN